MGWDDDYDYFVPASWSESEANLYDELVGGNPDIAGDHRLQFLYDAALFHTELSPPDRQIILDALKEYMWDEYSIDFDDAFDWDGYREWYENV